MNTILVIVGIFIAILIAIWLFGERGPHLRPTTKRFLKEAGFRRVINPNSFLHGYIYLRWLSEYINIALNYLIKIPYMTTFIINWFVNRYHSKALSLEQSRALISIDRDIPLRDLEHVIPYTKARDIVIKGPPDIAVTECACRYSTPNPNPCQPTQVCMIIGQPFVDFMMEHSPERSRRLTTEEAIELLEAEHERGHIQTAWFKDACLNRFYAICNCCKCCCGGVMALTKFDAPIISSSGYVPKIDKDSCNECLSCVEECPISAIAVVEDGVDVIWEKCLGCGICVSKCPNESISLVRDENKGTPLDVSTLEQ